MRMSKLRVSLEGHDHAILMAPMPLYHIFGFTMKLISDFFDESHSVLLTDPRGIN
jgi:long-chain acyl-CoA synthetase